MTPPPAPLLNFRSDNVAGVLPEVISALDAANHGPAAAYGDDEWSARLNDRFAELFEHSVTVIPVATGTAANALSLATVSRPWGGIYCYAGAHIQTSENGATEFFSGGTKLLGVHGDGFRIRSYDLAEALAHAGLGVRNRPQPDAVSITQPSELGTIYRLPEIRAIGAVARDAGIRFHVDGARFANALATLECSPADMTWRAGVDILSFGATKNGGMNADAIVVFDASLVEPLTYRLRRAGHTWSKMRFCAAQLLAYIEDDLYLRAARRANGLAQMLATGFAALPDIELVAPVEANIVFIRAPDSLRRALDAAGVAYSAQRDQVNRFVTRFDMDTSEVEELLRIARSAKEF